MRGLVLRVAPGSRPTQARVREALASIWAARMEGARVLDLFCGSGSVGIELLSRGAGHVTFVEEKREAIRVLRENLSRAGVSRDCVEILHRPVEIAVRELASAGRGFDLIYADPPYSRAVDRIDIAAWTALLERGGALALEQSKRSVRLEIEEIESAFYLSRRNYGETTLLLLDAVERADSPASE